MQRGHPVRVCGRGEFRDGAADIERPQAAEALAAFLDMNSLEPLHRYLRESGLDDADAHSRAAAIDAFVLGVSTRRRVLRSELDAPADLEAWLGATIQRLADG
ncbi:hypothetical protein [Nocardia vulneris]|uniref:TetR/AcrR family transcriptional regulator n=1 Tax=Nocardia vulneris TaxID=1141657 RepID=UPI001ADFC197|nr:hypothetical protein [Nocardia vulneris]